MNFDYANDEAAEAMGIFADYESEHGLPPGFCTEANQDMALATDYETDLSSDQKEFLDWYQYEVLPNWDQYVEEYDPPGLPSDPPGFDDNTDYTNQAAEDNFAPPDGVHVWNGEAGSGDGVTVNTDALDHFVSQMRIIVPQTGDAGVLVDSRNSLHDIDLRPGVFGYAKALKYKIEGGNGEIGLVPNMSDFLDALNDTVIRAANLLEEVSTAYKQTADDTTMTAEQFNEYMEQAWTTMDNLGDIGVAEADGEPTDQPAADS